MENNTTQADQPQTLIEAVRYFSDLDVCDEYLLKIKWPDGKPKCPKCDSDNVGRIKSRRKLQCREKDCRKQFSFKTETIFEEINPPVQDSATDSVRCFLFRRATRVLSILSPRLPKI